MNEYIKRLREWREKHGLDKEAEIEDMNEADKDFMKILSDMEKAKPQAPAGLVDKLRAWAQDVDFYDQDDAARFNEILSRYAKQDEAKDCGFTLADCPYERSSGITISKEELDEFREWKAKQEAKPTEDGFSCSNCLLIMNGLEPHKCPRQLGQGRFIRLLNREIAEHKGKTKALLTALLHQAEYVYGPCNPTPPAKAEGLIAKPENVVFEGKRIDNGELVSGNYVRLDFHNSRDYVEADQIVMLNGHSFEVEHDSVRCYINDPTKATGLS